MEFMYILEHWDDVDLNKMRYFMHLINIKYLEKYKGGRLKKEKCPIKKKILFSLVSEVSYNSITCFRHNGKLS